MFGWVTHARLQPESSLKTPELKFPSKNFINEMTFYCIFVQKLGL